MSGAIEGALSMALERQRRTPPQDELIPPLGRAPFSREITLRGPRAPWPSTTLARDPPPHPRAQPDQPVQCRICSRRCALLHPPPHDTPGQPVHPDPDGDAVKLVEHLACVNPLQLAHGAPASGSAGRRLARRACPSGRTNPSLMRSASHNPWQPACILYAVPSSMTSSYS